EAENERFDLLRDQWPPLPPSCVNGVDLLESDLDTAQTVGGQAALTNRFDLMNVRAEVVDAWRQLTVYANALLGVLNVEYRLQSSTPPGQAKPLAFGGSRNQHQLFVNGELPLVRKTERNNYRASLIAYQRVRRALQEAEDLTLQAVRGEIRQLRVFGVNYKIQQRQVEIAYRVIDGSIAALEEPPSPVGQQDVAARAAALTQQLLNAQRSLPTAQTTILNVWTNYMISRLQLYRDLELMRFDNRGVWIDDVATCQCPPAGQPGGRDRERPTELPAPRVVPPGEGPPLGDRR
ncbi:MAG TPA: hypothetical protein VFA26_09290, partial [Gemmataceae bacterium]|nr:hypothetical protein [Gemmataceae bacterium]